MAEVSFEDFEEVTRGLDYNKVMLLFGHLGIPLHIIKNAEHSAGVTDPMVKAWHILETWKQHKGNMATREALFEAKRKTFASEYSASASDSTIFDLGRCQQELIDFYELAMSRVNLLPWLDEETRDMSEIYVSLKLEENKKVLDTNEDLVIIKKDGKLAKRVLLKGTVGLGKSTLMGKLVYTWAQRKPSSPLYKYDLAFLLSFREIHEGCSIIDAIFQQILSVDTKVSKKSLDGFIRSTSNVLFLMDGFDEYFAENVDIVSGEIDAMLNFQTLRNACVIVSTRPHKRLGKCLSLYTPVILSGFSSQSVKCYLSKYFYNNSKLVDGLNRTFTMSDNLECLSHIPVMLMLMCLLWEDSQSLPHTQSELYAEFTTFLWKQFCHKYNIEFPDDNDKLKKVLVSLGKVAFDGLISKRGICQEKLIFCEEDFEDLEQGCELGLLTKERMRSKLSVSSAVTFLHKSFQEYCASYYLASLPGDQFDRTLNRIDTIDMIETKLEIMKFLCGAGDKDHAVRTIHYVIQVYLASITKDDSIHTDPDYTSDSVVDLHSYSINPVIILLLESDCQSTCVSVTNSLRSLLTTGKELRISDKSSAWPLFVKSPLASTLDQVKSIRFVLYGPILDVNSEALTHMTRVNAVRIELGYGFSSPVKGMNKLGSSIGILKDLVTLGLKCSGQCDVTPIIHPISAECKTLRTFEVDSVRCDVEGLCHLLAQQSHTLHTLSLSRVELRNGSIESILDTINMMKAPLRKLGIFKTHVGNAIDHIQHIIRHLHCLVLDNNDLTENDIFTLGEFLLNSKHLTSLDLTNNRVGKAVSTLGCVIPQLEILNLTHTHLTESDILTLSESVKKAKCMTDLNLSYNNVGKSVCILGCVIPQLEKLNLLRACLTESGILTLSEFLVEAKCLTYLNLSYDIRDMTGGMRVCESLKSCSNLKELWLYGTGFKHVDTSGLKEHLSNLKIKSEY